MNSLQWDPIQQRSVLWELRLYRFCHSEAEDQCHAMLYCIGSAVLTQRRGLFFSNAKQVVPGVQTVVLSLPPPDSLHLVCEQWVVGILTKYTFDVLGILDTVQLYLHPALLHPSGLSPYGFHVVLESFCFMPNL
jgi:hypothetical protein